MPFKKTDYAKIVIYIIQHKEDESLLYVGSTTDFTKRKSGHKSRCNNCNDKRYNSKLYTMIRDNGGWQMFNILVVKEFPCSNKQEALLEEDKIMKEMKANMNTIKAHTSVHERCEQMKEYKLINRDKILLYNKNQITCECGCILSRHCLSRHIKTKKHIRLLSLLCLEP